MDNKNNARTNSRAKKANSSKCNARTKNSEKAQARCSKNSARELNANIKETIDYFIIVSFNF